jgi:TrmH family RNA methyltransferase
VLTSLKNPKIAAAVRLKKGAYRDREGRFLIEGAQGVSEALDQTDRLETLFVSDDTDPLAIRARQAGVDVVAVSEDVMHRLTSTVTPQGLVGVAPFVDVELQMFPDEGCVAILHEIRDPGNAGTVLRSADAAGATGVVFTAGSVDPYNPKTVRASAGSVFHVPVCRGVATGEATAELRAKGYRVLAMAPDGPLDLYRADLSDDVAFVFGNEARGLPADVLDMADGVVRVPIEGKAESLNLAAAATVCLFEWARRRSGSDETLEAIVSSAAHDIRSPLTAMKGFGYALERRWGQMTTEQREIMLRGIVHDADRMDTIVRQLVDAARVIGGTLEIFPERTDVAELVSTIAEQQLRDPDHPAVEWTGSVREVLVDPSRLKTAVQAFLESLVWWCTEGPVRVEGEVVAGRLLLSASRAGTDLTSEQADALFVPRRPGTGGGSKMGMFVTRAVAQAQGGRAWAEVDAGRLMFHLEIPVGLGLEGPL